MINLPSPPPPSSSSSLQSATRHRSGKERRNRRLIESSSPRCRMPRMGKSLLGKSSRWYRVSKHIFAMEICRLSLLYLNISVPTWSPHQSSEIIFCLFYTIGTYPCDLLGTLQMGGAQLPIHVIQQIPYPSATPNTSQLTPLSLSSIISSREAYSGV